MGFIIPAFQGWSLDFKAVDLISPPISIKKLLISDCLIKNSYTLSRAKPLAIDEKSSSTSFAFLIERFVGSVSIELQPT